MKDEPGKTLSETWRRIIIFVLLFWVGYLTIAYGVGFVTSITIGSKVWQLIAWGFISSAGLIVLTRFLIRIEKVPDVNHDLESCLSSLRRFSIGVLLGATCFGVHVLIVAILSGPISFEWVPGVGAIAATIYFIRFLSTSCMEELGFRQIVMKKGSSQEFRNTNVETWKPTKTLESRRLALRDSA